MDSTPFPALLSATEVAQHFHFRCDRRLRYQITPPECASGAVPFPNSDPTLGPRVGAPPGSLLLLAAGRRWERRATERALRHFGAEAVRFAGWEEGGSPAPLPADEVVAALREPGQTQLLVQPQLHLQDAAPLLRRLGLPDGVSLAIAQPDLIRVRRAADGSPVFRLVDVKASREPSLAHLAQVAFYSLLLEELCHAEGIAGRAETRWGWVWTRGARGPRRFALGAYRYHVQRVLRDEVAHVAGAHPAEAAWHLAPRCGACRFYEHCRAEADATDDLARVVGITPLAKQVLRERGIGTAAALNGNLRRDTYTGCHALERGEAHLRRQAQAIAWNKVIDGGGTTERMPMREGVRLVVCAEHDPVHDLGFALGLRVEGGSVEGDVWIAERPTRAAERAMLREFLGRLGAVLAATPSVQLFVWERSELEILQRLLERHLEDAAVRPAAARLLAALAPDAEARGAAPLTLLLDAVADLFALPVPYAYDLASVSRVLAPAEGAAPFRVAPRFRLPMSSRVSWVPVHRVWRGGEGADAVRRELRGAVAAKLAGIDSVVRGVREWAARRGRERLLLHAAPPGQPEPPLAHPELEGLRIFARVEAAAEAASIRALHALPETERAARWECIRGMELLERRADGALVFEFAPECRDAKFRPGDFSLLLTNEGSDTLARIARQPWLRWPLLCELLEYDLAASPPRVVLAPGGDLAKAEASGLIDLQHRCVLDRAATDFATRRILATLRALDEGASPGARQAVALLEGRGTGGGLPPETVAATRESLIRAAGARRGIPVLNPEQAEAWQAALGEGVSLVWGPPGTGKTYLLAWILLGFAAATRPAGGACRIGVVAATHRAVVNVLGRLAAECASAEAVPLRAAKLRGSGSAADGELQGSGVELVADGELPSLLDAAGQGGTPLVVGGTVWSLWKQMREMGDDASPVHPCWDVLVVDEASQMTVPQALIAAAGLREGGQLILCGDDRQLAPVIRGRYGADQAALTASAFARFAAHYPKRILRESRRMNGALVAYPRDVFYPGLRAANPMQRIRLAPAPARGDDARLTELFLDPDDAVVFCTYAGVRAGARNPWEAGIVARLLLLLRERLTDPSTGALYSPERFASHGAAVVSPHRAQNAAILAELQAHGWGTGPVPPVDTVERMQGAEREVVLVSYAVADAEYARAEAEFLLNPNRFNVAITRPRSKLILLLSEEVLAVLPADAATLAASLPMVGYVAHCTDRVRETELPAATGDPVRATLRYRCLA